MSSPTGMCLLFCARAVYADAAAIARKLRRERDSFRIMQKNGIIFDFRSVGDQWKRPGLLSSQSCYHMDRCKMPWWRASLCLIAILLVEACSFPSSSTKHYDHDLPDLPKLTIGSFRPQIRDRVRKAYEDVQAKPRDPEVNGRLGM